ncbi:MAG: DNA translocase FtsK 4TM domain-containing protein [Oscillospiraceae bacterium]|nr:DNA translocase FtsK 4TM domain-containing protein [Oscillospiraceae bacterium]
MIAVLVLLALGVFSSLGYFVSAGTSGKVIGILCDLMKGLCGWGYYILPPLLIIGAIQLVVRRSDKHAGWRTAATICISVIFGSIMHLILCRTQFSGVKLIGELWKSGVQNKSGGIIAGGLAELFVYLFSTVGAVIIFVIILVLLVIAACRVRVGKIVEDVMNRPEKEKKERVKPVREVPVKEEVPEKEEEKKPRKRTRRSDIDIPLDYDVDETTGEIIEKKPTPKPVFEPEIIPEPVKTVEEEPEKLEEEVEEIIPEPEEEEIVVEETIVEEPEEEDAATFDDLTTELDGDEDNYVFPPLDLLPAGVPGGALGEGAGEARTNAERLESAFRSFGVNLSVVGFTRGPKVTRYEAEIEAGTKLSKLENLEKDIALALGTSSVRIAAMPNKIATVGIEIPNKVISTVYLRDIIDSTEFKNSSSRLTFAIGQNISGDAIVGNIAKMPHLLVAGTTGSGKSVCLNSLILSILYKASPDEVKFIMIDPKMVEFKIYNGIPHLLVPVVTEPKKAAGALQWAVVEMEKRYRYLSDENVRDLASYNEVMKTREDGKTLPQLVVVIDELADLMMTASKEVEESIIRIAQMGRAAGVHLVIATQSPRADIITGLMKSNIPARIALQVSSALESRIIMEATGADKLLGNGDMLFRKDSGSKPVRIQGTWVSDEEREDVINFIKRSGDAEYAADVIAQIEKAAEDKNSKSAKAEEPNVENDYDDLLPQAVDVVFNLGQASVSQLQRRLKLGYSRAARIVDQMEELGIIGPFEGAKPRSLLITRQQWQERQFIHGTAPIETLPDEEPADNSDEAPF